jgi:hypothetical protein
MWTPLKDDTGPMPSMYFDNLLCIYRVPIPVLYRLNPTEPTGTGPCKACGAQLEGICQVLTALSVLCVVILGHNPQEEAKFVIRMPSLL